MTAEADTRTFARKNGEIQRVQCVRLDSWAALRFFSPTPAENALACYADIYRKYLVPACPWIFGSMLLFRLPEGTQVPGNSTPGRAGQLTDPLLRAAELLRGVHMTKQGPVFRTPEAKALYLALDGTGAIELAAGKLPTTRVIPVRTLPGYLTESAPQNGLAVNSAFFIMDCFDCASPYDTVGTPFGLAVRDGEILRPPLFGREALLVCRDGTVRIERPALADLRIELDGREYLPGKNCRCFSRPDCARTPAEAGTDVVVIGREVIAVRSAGGTCVPASGFVLHLPERVSVQPGTKVNYRGMENISFGLQVGSSTVIGGTPVHSFGSRYYSIYRPWTTEFPPSLYPLNYRKSRAARIVLGADADGRPMLLWAEGAAKTGHIPGKDSCGAALYELADICTELGMVNGINLDGGGSAQLLLRGIRSLQLSDRSSDGTERERPVPEALAAEF